MGARRAGSARLGAGRRVRAPRPGATRRLPTLAAALEAHCLALSACRRCGLDDPTALPIIAEARSPQVMLVGQAPGKTETVDPRPFTGRAGKTLFRWLSQAGVSEALAREHIYIGAVTRCYPGPNASGRGDRVPSRREQALCAEWLTRELELIRPAVLIPVGRLAIDRFLPAAPLEQLVGRVHTVRHAGGESLAVPLPHPSGASSWVHEPGHRALLDRALTLLRDLLAELGVGDAVASAVAAGGPLDSLSTAAESSARRTGAEGGPESRMRVGAREPGPRRAPRHQRGAASRGSPGPAAPASIRSIA